MIIFTNKFSDRKFSLLWMEWSKEKTLKLIELLQANSSLWNPSLCDTRRDKQKRKEELRSIAEYFGICVADITKKIQHLRTQYNREWAREARANAEEPNDRYYVSNWYAFEYLHFLKDSNKPFRTLQSDEHEHSEVNGSSTQTISDNIIADCKLADIAPPHKITRTDSFTVKPEAINSTSQTNSRDEFSVFGEYIANELRSLKGEMNLLVAKKKIQDIIFEMKMGTIAEPRSEQVCTVYTNMHSGGNVHGGKMYSTPPTDPLTVSHATPTSQISEIIINSACHYSNFKVDAQ